MALSNIIQNSVTYKGLIESAANTLYNLLKNDSLPQGVYKNTVASFTIGQGVVYGSAASSTNQAKTVQLSETEVRTDTYNAPSLSTIINDINTFMVNLGIQTDSSVPSNDGLVTFLFALNFFIEKAVIRKNASVTDSGVTHHLHYKAPSAASYDKLKIETSVKNTITEDKIGAIYSQVKSTSLLSDPARLTNIKS